MAKLTTAQIRDLARAIVEQHPGGIRYTDLLNRICGQHPETPRNTIQGSIWDLEKRLPTEVVKPSRGVYVPARSTAAEPRAPISVRESGFYEPFADYLKTELQEATEAFPLGGSGLRGKWGTPDVIGVYKKLPSDRVAFSGEILAAEIKVNPLDYVTAFGQAITYRLFAARTYIVMPSTMPEADQERLDALCMLFGVGFVVFDLNREQPSFRAKARAQRYAPDMFYLNRFADALHDHDREAFNKLFPLW